MLSAIHRGADAAADVAAVAADADADAGFAINVGARPFQGQDAVFLVALPRWSKRGNELFACCGLPGQKMLIDHGWCHAGAGAQQQADGDQAACQQEPARNDGDHVQTDFRAVKRGMHAGHSCAELRTSVAAI